MALIIEDGSLIVNANSYVTVAEAQAFAEARGIDVLLDDDVCEQKLLTAMDYLELVEPQLQGSRVDTDQTLAFPRQKLYINNLLFSATSIPSQIKKAQILLAIEAAKGVDLMPTINSATAARVKREKVGPIETEYDNSIAVGYVSFPQVDALLASMYDLGGFNGLMTRRG
jgi:hypothetical protein